MYCSNCGAQNEENARFCATCGANLEAADQEKAVTTPVENTVSEPVYEEYAEPAYDNYDYAEEAYEEAPVKDPGKGLAITGLILGIVSVALPLLNCLCGCVPIISYIVMFIAGLAPFTAVAGIICSAIAMSKSKKAGCKNSMAVIGLILSIVAVVIAIISIIIGIISIVLYGGASILGALMDSGSSSYPSYDYGSAVKDYYYYY